MRSRPARVVLAVVVGLVLGLGAFQYLHRGEEVSPGPAARVLDPTAPLDPELLQGDVEYVSLGDSFTSGPGLPPPAAGGEECRRSTRGYPDIVAAALDASLTNVSCLGARTEDVEEPQLLPNLAVQVPPQAEALDGDVGLVTISLGGNDDGLYNDLISTCTGTLGDSIATSACRDRFGEDVLADLATAQAARLSRAADVVRSAAPSARIVIIGYPMIFDAGCQRSTMSSSASRTADAVVRALNTGSEEAARSSQVRFVDLYGPSREHGVCAQDPWVNGASAEPGGAWAWHPLPAGMEASARVIVEQLDPP